MGSRKEEERNEKIIRGLMKLPPNRRCINCNSLGPQYVCTNFWTFVCMTCSGIHREFTHRVKSVSMSKFSSQEVEALQNGGNQRAREIYLRDWDQQRQRLPDNSNVDKVREFIKSVYVDKRYGAGKTADKPPRDLQRHGSNMDDTRRASSYHSYSQSPPYDFQYEDRHYGKQGAVLTRKPGSDRGLYAGKISSFVCSPTRLSERSFEDRFANEGSVSRFSDYSVSSGGDAVRSGAESPRFQKDIGLSSPPIQPSREISGEDVQHQTLDLFSEANFKPGANGIPRSQRSASFGSIGSFDSNSMSIRSYNSGNLVDNISEPEQTTQAHQGKVTTSPRAFASATASHGSLDLFNTPARPESGSLSAAPIDLFQLPAASPNVSVDLFKVSSSNTASYVNFNQSSKTSPHSPVDLFGGTAQQQPAIEMPPKSTESSIKDEGWATFDAPQHTVSTLGIESSTPPSSVSATFDQFSSSNGNVQWPPMQNSGTPSSSPVLDPWLHNFNNVQVAAESTYVQTWNAFDNSMVHHPVENVKQDTELQVEAYNPLSTTDQYLSSTALEGSNNNGTKASPLPYEGFLGHIGSSDFVMGPSYTPPDNPLMDQPESHTTDHRSSNPFDLPYDSGLESGNMFLHMSSLQAALPHVHMPASFIDGASQPWFPQDPVSAYLPANPQGGRGYMAGQAQSSQLTNVQTQGPVASIGGNPFA